MKLLLYCTKAKPYLNCDYGKDNHEEYSGDWNIYLANKQNECSNIVNGKIVAECDFDVEEINYRNAKFVCNRYYLEILKRSCLTDKQMYDYLKGEKGYAIYIKNLYVFDKPRFIQDYSKNENPYNYIENAPQNMCYAFDVKSFNEIEKYILISIQSQWLCKILNGEKIIEVRKKVLKEMI
jgi:predicted transcriptional regulator